MAKKVLVRKSQPSEPDPPDEEVGGLLVALGDSVTNDQGGSDPSYATYGAAELDPALDYDNLGIDGTGAQDWIDDISTTLALFDAVPDAEPKIISVMLGNTLHHEGAGATDKAIELFDLIRRSSNNIKVAMIGDFDRTDAGYRTQRTTDEAWGVTGLGLYFDAFVSMKDELPDGMGADGAAADDTWYPTDGTHPGILVHEAAAPIYAACIDAVVAAFLSDSTAPEIVRLTPEDGAATVQVGEFPFVARFNEHVKFGASVLIGLYDGDDVLVESWDEGDIGSGIAVHGVDLEITPSENLTADSDYYINIASGSIEDIGGNVFAGITDTTTWRFTVPAAVDITPNLVAFWEMEEASGTRADSAASNDLTDNNTVTRDTGKAGNAAVFTPANSEYLSAADSADLGYSGDFSVAFWFYRGSEGEYIMCKGNDTFAQNEWVFRAVFATGRQLRFSVYETGGGIVSATTGAISDSTWYLAVGTYTAATKELTVSLNAGTRATNTLSNNPARKAQELHIGRFGSNYWDGRLDEVGFWKRALTVEEEAWLYNLGNGRTYAEIAATGA